MRLYKLKNTQVQCQDKDGKVDFFSAYEAILIIILHSITVILLKIGCFQNYSAFVSFHLFFFVILILDFFGMRVVFGFVYICQSPCDNFFYII